MTLNFPLPGVVRFREEEMFDVGEIVLSDCESADLISKYEACAVVARSMIEFWGTAVTDALSTESQKARSKVFMADLFPLSCRDDCRGSHNA